VKSSFRSTLVNGPFQDPALYVALRWQGDAILFDLGRIDRLSPAHCLRLSYVCVSHTHMDHFMGFDQLLRLTLPRDRQLTFCGPPGLIANVAGKLAGYTWNLTADYSFGLAVIERHADRLVRARFRAATGFAREPLPDVSAPAEHLVAEPAFRIETTTLDHRIPCLAFCVSEPRHLNVRTDALEALALRPGPWLTQLKAALRAGREDEPVAVVAADGTRTFTAGELGRELIEERAGQRIAYVVDTRFDAANAARIVALARRADLLYAEARFLHADRDEAEKRHHLTARQSGFLARAAGVRRLEVFHFSPRYQGMAQAFHAEARAELHGETRLEDEESWAAELLLAAPPPGSGVAGAAGARDGGTRRVADGAGDGVL
jgi:ribonuclease Z